MKRGGGNQRNNVLAIDALDRPTTEYRFHSPVLHAEIARNGNRSDSYNRQPQNVHRDETRVAPVRDTTEAESTQVSSDRSHTTPMHMKETRGEYVTLRKATIVIKNGARRVVVNALLDDASGKTYINS